MRSKSEFRMAGACNEQCGWKDGLYAVTYFRDGERDDSDSKTLAILREGTLIGSDEHGGVFEGLFAVTRCGSAACIAVTLQVPPGGVLIAGDRPATEEAAIDIVGVLSKTGSDLHGVCDIRGHQMAVRFRYVGMLPH